MARLVQRTKNNSIVISIIYVQVAMKQMSPHLVFSTTIWRKFSTIISKLFYLHYSSTNFLLTEFRRTRSWFSDVNDSTDYLRLLNNTWSDHLIRSVREMLKIFNVGFHCWFLDADSAIIYRSRSNLCFTCECPEYLVSNSHRVPLNIIDGYFRELNQDLFRRFIMKNSTISTR